MGVDRVICRRLTPPPGGGSYDWKRFYCGGRTACRAEGGRAACATEWRHYSRSRMRFALIPTGMAPPVDSTLWRAQLRVDQEGAEEGLESV